MSDNILITHVGTTAFAWLVQFLDEDGDPLDLTNATAAKINMTDRKTGSAKITDGTGFVADGNYTLPDGSAATYAKTDGVVGYQPVTGDVDTSATYDAQFEVTIGGQPYFSPWIEVRLKPSL